MKSDLCLKDLIQFRKDHLKISPPVIDVNESLNNVIHLLAESRQAILIVMENEKFLGAVTDQVLINEVVLKKLDVDRSLCLHLELEKKEVFSDDVKLEEVLSKYQHGKVDYILTKSGTGHEIVPIFAEDIIDCLMQKVSSK